MSEQQYPWKNGIYRFKSSTQFVMKINDDVVEMKPTGCLDIQAKNDLFTGAIQSGSFGPAADKVKEKTGQDEYNVEMKLWGGMLTMGAVLNPDKQSMALLEFMNNTLDELYMISEKDLQELIDSGDSLDNLSTPYKIQPENQGKLIWISGPPGAGKSTTAQLFSRNNGYVYYEADCVMNHANPYIPKDRENPSMGQWYQNHIKNVKEDHFTKVSYGEEFYMALTEGGDFNRENAEKFYTFMTECVVHERKRLGGDFAIAQAVPHRILRDTIRKIAGPDLIFILLIVPKETTLERLKKRHGEGEAADQMTEWCIKINEFYEPTGADEKNTFDVVITSDMSPTDVAKKIEEILQ